MLFRSMEPAAETSPWGIPWAQWKERMAPEAPTTREGGGRSTAAVCEGRNPVGSPRSVEHGHLVEGTRPGNHAHSARHATSGTNPPTESLISATDCRKPLRGLSGNCVRPSGGAWAGQTWGRVAGICRRVGFRVFGLGSQDSPEERRAALQGMPTVETLRKGIGQCEKKEYRKAVGRSRR